MKDEPTELFDGVSISATEFQKRRQDVMFFVAAGNVVYYSAYGGVRMALVPPSVGDAYLAKRTTQAGAPTSLSQSEHHAPEVASHDPQQGASTADAAAISGLSDAEGDDEATNPNGGA